MPDIIAITQVANSALFSNTSNYNNFMCSRMAILEIAIRNIMCKKHGGNEKVIERPRPNFFKHFAFTQKRNRMFNKPEAAQVGATCSQNTDVGLLSLENFGCSDKKFG